MSRVLRRTTLSRVQKPGKTSLEWREGWASEVGQGERVSRLAGGSKPEQEEEEASAVHVAFTSRSLTWCRNTWLSASRGS